MLRGGVGMSGPVKGINSLDSSADLLRDLLLLSAITNPRQLFSYPGPGMSATEPRECLPGPLATYMHTHPAHLSALKTPKVLWEYRSRSRHSGASLAVRGGDPMKRPHNLSLLLWKTPGSSGASQMLFPGHLEF